MHTFASGLPTPTVQWQTTLNQGNTWTDIVGATSTTLSFVAAGADDSKQYRAMFVNTIGSASSAAATLVVHGGGATTPTFADDTVLPHVTPLRALHVIQLRNRIDELLVRFGLAAMSWTDSRLSSTATIVRAAHLAEMRSALTTVYLAAGRAAPIFASGTIGAGTVIAASHVAELRAAIVAIW